MITVKNNYFKIDTLNSTYLFKVNPIGTLENIHYGKRIENYESYDFLEEQNLYGAGSQDIGKNEDGTLYQIYNDCGSFEFSNKYRGDNREVFIEISKDNDRECNFLFEKYEIVKDFTIEELPSALNKKETLVVYLIDRAKKLRIKLYYSTYDDSDVITKSASITNLDNREVTIERFMSSQVDLVDKHYSIDTLIGAWAKERHIESNRIPFGITKIDSKYGYSSARVNPYVVIKEPDTTLQQGNCYGFNLIYSGNHVTYVQRNSYKKIRILNGINDSTFSWKLNGNETFDTPESTICFSCKGTNGLTTNYHSFIKNNIVRGYWKNKVRPIVFNTWEGVHRDFDENVLLDMAKVAKKYGTELFVVDDGWFGNRKHPTDGFYIGDWFADKNKFPSGIDVFANKIRDEVGLKFGLWFEPEMVAIDSEIYQEHPDWVVRHPSYDPLIPIGRFVLDLTKPEVVDYLIDAVSKQIELTKLDYLKWDCNRDLADIYSSSLMEQNEFSHRYILGFYRLVKTLTSKYPKVLFESCAGGGNRVDMGILCYMPQFWCSDNTDPFDRMLIQEGTLTCYPQSCIGMHVSNSPNLQTGRSSMIENRFNVACIGAFGYELDLRNVSLVDAKAIKNQIKWYKENRELLEFGDYYKISSLYDTNHYQFVIISKDKTEGIYFIGNGVQELYADPVFAKIPGINRDFSYKFETRQQCFSHIEGGSYFKEVKEPCHEYNFTDDDVDKVLPFMSEKQEYIVKGSTLEDVGVRLYYEWVGGNANPKRIMFDFGTRIYKIKKI